MVGVVVQKVDLIWRYWVMDEGSEEDLAEGIDIRRKKRYFVVDLR